MNAFEQFLMTDAPRPGVGAEVLEMLGRKAADRFLSQGMPLNDAVHELVSEHPELGNEHIKRVVEFANNVAFQEMFSKSDDKNIHFDVADPGVVIRDLKDGGSPSHDGKVLDSGSKDYMSPPTREKDSFGDPESGMQHLERMNNNEGRFGQGEQIEKQALLSSLAANIGGSMAIDKASGRTMKGHDQNLAVQNQLKGTQMGKVAGIREMMKSAYEIKPEDRGDIPKKDFAQPNKEEEGHKGKYPISDKQHAKSALGFAKMHGDTGAMAAVKKKVEKKFPEMLDGEEAEAEKKEKESCLGKCADWRLQGLEQDLVNQFIKEASPAAFEQLNQHEHANPVENVYDLRVKLAAARVELARSHEQFDLLVKTAREDLYQAIKHEVMDPNGAGINGVMHALTKVADETSLSIMLPQMAARLVTESVPQERLQITKTAAKADLVNYHHPIVMAWGGLVKAADDQAKTQIALAEIDAGLEQVNEFLQQAVR